MYNEIICPNCFDDPAVFHFNRVMSELSEGNLSPAMRRIIKRAAVEAEASGTTEIAVVHVLIGMLQEGQNVASQLLAEKEITVESLRLLDFKK